MSGLEKGVVILDPAQRAAICRGWISEMGQQQYKKLLDLLLEDRMGPTPWTDILDYAVQYCAKNFCVEYNDILKMLKDNERMRRKK